MLNDEEKVLNSHGAGKWASAAAIDVARRNEEAYKAHQEFYDDPEHGARVEAVRKILLDFFGKNIDLYENQRANRGNPYTALKVTNHVFPAMSSKEKDRRYRDPLKKHGVVIKFMKGTNSYIYEVR